MVKKLSKYGNSLALILDKPLLELLEIDENTQLKIKTNGEAIIIIPVKKKRLMKKATNEDQDIIKSGEEIMDKYSEALKKLASN